MPSLSRELAKWIVGLRYEDLPPEVVDRAKGVTLHCISSVLLGSQTKAGKQAVKFITDEEAGVSNARRFWSTAARSHVGAPHSPIPKWHSPEASGTRTRC